MADASSENEWIEWAGGECPVDRNALVDVRFRDGEEAAGEVAWFWLWGHSHERHRNGDPADDIIAYRMVQS